MSDATACATACVRQPSAVKAVNDQKKCSNCSACYGHLCDPKHSSITVDEGEAYLAADMADALRATLRYCPVLTTEPDGRLAAIVDFTFNLGAGRLQASTLRRRVNQRDWTGAAQELLRWVHGGGRVLPGLVLRREAELALLLGHPEPA